MSLRNNSRVASNNAVLELQKGLEDLKSQYVADDVVETVGEDANAHEFDNLSRTEQSAASLGVQPDAWKPISFLNKGHYEQLLKSNALDDSLARRIEVRDSLML